MSFLSPIWLLALPPWGAIAFWLLRGQRRRVSVPFLQLWRGSAALPHNRQRMELPPIPVALVLLAMLLAILAASAPAIRRSQIPPVTVIVDRGLTMSARGGNDLRFRETFAEVDRSIQSRFPGSQVRWIAVPGDEISSASALTALPPTAIDTRPALHAAIERQLSESGDPVLVVSDQLSAAQSDRIISVAPDRVIENVGIVKLAARELPIPQVMVRVRGQSAQSTSTLIVACSGQVIRRKIDLPSRGAEHDYFVDIPLTGSTISAELSGEDDLPADHRAWLVREGNAPRIEVISPVGPELGRLIEAYQKSRLPVGDPAPLAVVTDASQMPTGAPAVAVVKPKDSSMVSGPAEIRPHPITAHVSWDSLPKSIQLAEDPPAGWTPLVSIDGRALIAVRPEEPRQIWVGFDAPQWAHTADYVVFWTNVFDWIGGGNPAFAAHELSEWTPQWKPVEPLNGPAGQWPGLYRGLDGTIRAFNAPDLPLPAPANFDWRKQLSDLAISRRWMDASGVLIIAAIICLLLACLSWARKPSLARDARTAQLTI